MVAERAESSGRAAERRRAEETRASARRLKLALEVTLNDCEETLQAVSAARAGTAAQNGGENAADARDHLRRALATRTTIGIALGTLMERYRLEQDAAWRLLQRVSSTSNRKVVDVAEIVIDDGTINGVPVLGTLTEADSRARARARPRPSRHRRPG